MAHIWSLVIVYLLSLADAQSSLCYWRDFRSGVIRDTLYLEGGFAGMRASGGLVTFNGTDAKAAQFNFSNSFNQDSNFTDIFLIKSTISKDKDPYKRPYVNGYMVANDAEWYAFGGRAYPSYDNRIDDTGVMRNATYGSDGALQPNLGFTPIFRPAGGNYSHLYITNGGGVSIPSEKLGFYFGGLQSSNRSHLNYNTNPNTSYPSILSNSMLRIDMKIWGNATWDNITLPEYVSPRADAMLAWIPIGLRGIVIVIGGVPYPASVNELCSLTNSTWAEINNVEGTTNIQTVAIYDVASGSWYNQSTYGVTQPPQLAQACVVVASSADNTIHNIHIYGGYDGSNTKTPSDDVWILSVPSFTWIKVPSADQSHGRFRHTCVKPYPNQMMVVGGTTNCNQCLATKAFADVFDLNSLTWSGSYDPTKWSNYTVPASISNAIRATPTALMNTALSAIFNTPYQSAIRTFYPYPPAQTSTVATSSPSPSSSSVPDPQQQGLQPWMYALIVLGAVLVALAVGILVVCRLRRRKNKSVSQSGRSRRSISKWVFGHPPEPKSTRSDDETTQVDTMHEVTGDSYFPKGGARTETVELHSDTQANSYLNSPLSSPGIPSPSSRGGAELYTPAIRHELPGMQQASLFSSPNIRNHPLYPPSLGGYTSVSQNPSVSSPMTGLTTPYELAQNSSSDQISKPAPNDQVMRHAKVHSPHMTAAMHGADDVHSTMGSSPSLSGVELSTQQGSIDAPITPLQQPVMTTRAGHKRNASSVSSGLPDLSSPSPREEQRRSHLIANLPDSPGTEAPVYMTSNDINGMTRVPQTSQIRRKDVPIRPQNQ